MIAAWLPAKTLIAVTGGKRTWLFMLRAFAEPADQIAVRVTQAEES